MDSLTSCKYLAMFYYSRQMEGSRIDYLSTPEGVHEMSHEMCIYPTTPSECCMLVIGPYPWLWVEYM